MDRSVVRVRRCPRCMSGRMDESGCPDCGYQPDGAEIGGVLPEGLLLRERYRLGIPVFRNRQALFYAAWDEIGNRPVVAEEFFPQKACVRQNRNAVPTEEDRERFEQAVRLFRDAPQRTEGRPAPCADAFADHGTAVRIYPSAPGRLQEDAAGLAEAPILFRDGQGRPLMTISALRIPPFPDPRRPRSRRPADRPETDAGEEGPEGRAPDDGPLQMAEERRAGFPARIRRLFRFLGGKKRREHARDQCGGDLQHRMHPGKQ